MGNEHSNVLGSNSSRDKRNSAGGGSGRDASSPSTSLGGMPASFSFLAKKRNSTRSSGMLSSIVVVNEGASGSNSQADPAKDPDLQRIKEIPYFLPLLRSVLPGYRDPPEVHQKIGNKPFLRFLHCLQQHFRNCSQTVAAEQGRLFARIVEIDQFLNSLLKKTVSSSKKLDSLNIELKKLGPIEEQLEATQIMLQELVQSADALNQLLSPDDRLAPIQYAFTPILTKRKFAESAGKMCSSPTASVSLNSKIELTREKLVRRRWWTGNDVED